MGKLYPTEGLGAVVVLGKRRWLTAPSWEGGTKSPLVFPGCPALDDWGVSAASPLSLSRTSWSWRSWECWSCRRRSLWIPAGQRISQDRQLWVLLLQDPEGREHVLSVRRQPPTEPQTQGSPHCLCLLRRAGTVLRIDADPQAGHRAPCWSGFPERKTSRTHDLLLPEL